MTMERWHIAVKLVLDGDHSEEFFDVGPLPTKEEALSCAAGMIGVNNLLKALQVSTATVGATVYEQKQGVEH